MLGWAKIKAASKYAGVSERTFRKWLKDGLKHSRLPKRTVLIAYDDIDAYLKKYATRENQVEIIADKIFKDLNK